MPRGNRKSLRWRAAVLAGLLVAFGQPAAAQDPIDDVDGADERYVSPNVMGGIGLLQTRTARFGPDGLFQFGYSRVSPHKRVFLTVNAFPWVEATFRYTEFTNQLYSPFPWFSGDQTLKDRGADLKFRLLREGPWRPALAIGLQDGLGTGIFSGEYLVASKRFGDFDFSLGMGWGYLGSKGEIKNPLIRFSDRFRARNATGGPGGAPTFLNFFTGETVGMFGGVEYRTPFEGLTFQLEYDGHAYSTNPETGDLADARPYNIGFNFRPYSWLDVSLGRERGELNMLRVSLRAELHDPGVPKFDPPPPPVEQRPTITALAEDQTVMAAAERDAEEVSGAPQTAADPAAALFAVLESRGLGLTSFDLDGAVAMIGFERTRGWGFGGPPDLDAAAAEALSVLPENIREVALRAETAGPAGAARASRDSAPSPVDALFAGLSAIGLSVEGVEIDGERARVAVLAVAPGRASLTEAAEIAAAALSVDEATVSETSTGLFATWTGFGVGPVAPAPAPAIATAIATAAATAVQFRLPPVDPPYTEEQRLEVARKMADALEAEGFFLETLQLEERRATVALTGSRYASSSRNLGFAVRVIINYLPAPIEEITVVLLRGGMEMSRTTMRRSDIERAAAGRGSPDEVLARATIESGQPGWPGFRYAAPGRYPQAGISIAPQMRQHIGGPDQFYLYQFWLSANIGADLARGLSVTGTYGKDLYNNFDKIRLKSDSVLPHVRSDIKEYLQQGADGNIVRLQSDFFFKVSQNAYARISAGLFEEMFGGVGAELMYRPFESRLALGVEMNRVRQRAYDQLFDFNSYQVDTGHASIYYEEPRYNSLLSLHVGRYLAGDKGATFEISRRFDGGVRVGAWATLTDVPFAQFGEGSFDKGFFIVIPFDTFLTRSSTETGVFAFRPLFRDGGQRLVLAQRLYDVTAPATLEAVTRDWPRMFK